MIAVQNLTKVYGKRAALDHVSFEVPEREIFGFVGPNGAGKTTTLRILAALLEPTEGKAYIDGADVTKEREKVHTRIGYMPDFFGVYDQLTLAEYLDFYAACYRQPKSRRQKIVEDLLALVGMTERKNQLVDTLSRGLKQRACLPRALRHDPAAAIEVLTPLAAIRHVEAVNGSIEAEYDGDERTASDILIALTGAGIRVSSFTPVDGGLEDAFLKATSEEVG